MEYIWRWLTRLPTIFLWLFCNNGLWYDLHSAGIMNSSPIFPVSNDLYKKIARVFATELALTWWLVLQNMRAYHSPARLWQGRSLHSGCCSRMSESIRFINDSRNTSRIIWLVPSWELTYALQKRPFWVDDFPFPRWDMSDSLEGKCMEHPLF